MWQDVKQALRGLGRAPAFTLASLLTLALGIGGTTAMFSVVHDALFKQPPLPEPDRLFVLRTVYGGAVSGEVFHFVRERTRSFERVAASHGSPGWNLVAEGEAEYVEATRVTDGFFALLGRPPRLGRELTRAESRPDGPPSVLLSESLWRRRFDARPDVVGHTVELGGNPHTVVGVVGDLRGTVFESWADAWTPLQLSRDNNSWSYTVYGRLRPGVSQEQARRELESLHPAMARELWHDDRAPFERRVVWTPYREWREQGRRPQLLLLLGAVGFLLLIACVNVASLQLARNAARQRELATRAALGGSRGRLARQVLTESLLLGLGGGALGLLVARSGVWSLSSLVPESVSLTQQSGLDWRVVLVAVAISVGTGLFVGVAPVRDNGRLDLRGVLWEGGLWHTASRRATRLRRVFVVAETALAVVLLIGAGVLVRTLVNLRSQPLGFEARGVLTAPMSLQGFRGEEHGGVPQFFERTLARIHELPSVEAAAVGSHLPIERGLNLGFEPPAGGIVDEATAVDWTYCSVDYFTLFRIPLRTGRLFDERDTAGGAPAAIVNEAFGRAYFGRPDVVGETVRLAGPEEKVLARRIVGIVGDVKARSGAGWTNGRNALAAPSPPILYVPVAQVPDELLTAVHESFPTNWIIRGRQAAADLVPAIQDVVRATEPSLPFIRIRTMSDIVTAETESERFHMLILGAFAMVAMVLAGIGIYGLVAYGVAQRTQEVGVRMALGATAGAVVGRFVREGLVLALAGVALGLAGAAALSRTLESFVWGVEPLDPLTYATVAVVLIAVASLASLAPALRAARLDPTRALRQE